MRAMTTVAYTDGACRGNPGPGGWAWAVPGGPFAAGAEARSTNQRMEIKAALEAVRALPGPLEVVSDSTYVVNCFRDRWWEGWIKRGWVNSQRKPVANRDLWEPLVALVVERGDVSFRWVKGHSGDPMNDLVDRLAVEAAATQRPRSGDAPPDVVGPPDASWGRGEVDDPEPSAGAGSARAGTGAVPGPPGTASRAAGIGGHPIAVFGHRPPELGGYGPNPVADAVRARLVQILTAKHQLTADLVVVSGLRLGAETLGAEAALEVGLPLVAVLPYPDPQSVWPTASQERFGALLARAVEVITLERRAPADRAAAGAALARRDAWLARHVAEAVLVWDGDDRSLAKLHRTLVQQLGEEEVWILEPTATAGPPGGPRGSGVGSTGSTGAKG